MISKYVTAALLAAIMAGAGGVDAKTLALKDQITPAEFPPASFKGSQYVDSRGCVFIRAGIDGNTTWVPRVSRSRTVICGFQPSLPAGQGTSIASAPQSKAPVQIIPSDAAQVAATSDGAVRGTSKTASAAAAGDGSGATATAAGVTKRPVLFQRKTKTAAAQPRVSAPAAARAAQAPMRTVASISTLPRPLAAAPTNLRPAPAALAKPQAAPKPVVVTRAAPAPSCQGASAISNQYIGTSRPGLPVRCGPQAGGAVTRSATYYTAPVADTASAAPVTTAQGSRAAAMAAPQPVQQLAPNTRIIPRHVYEARRAAGTANIKTPKGYRHAWDDGRLNPRRAEQTVAGVQAMDLRWTKTVPRKLYDAHDGRVVNKLFPNLRYPFTSMAQQNKASAMVVARTEAAPARLSTRRSPAPAPRTAVAPSQRYVQVGSFGQSGNASRTASKLKAMGLPVRTSNSGGLTVVMAGPFASGSHTQGALLALRSAGFADAFAR